MTREPFLVPDVVMDHRIDAFGGWRSLIGTWRAWPRLAP